MSSYQERSEISKASNVLIASNDYRFNYQFTNNEKQLDKLLEAKETPVMIPMHKYDYSLRVNDGNDISLPQLCPLSLASCGKNLEDVEAFYAAKFPRLPNEYHGILARYSVGQPFTRKEVKNTIKKSKKKNKDLPVGLSIAKKDISLSFD